MKLRRFNDLGVERFREFIDEVRQFGTFEVFPQILRDPAFTKEVPGGFEVREKPFANRFEAAEYLYDRIPKTNLDEPERDIGLWTWLSAFWFDQLCPKTRNGMLDPKHDERWIPQPDQSFKYYRHLLLGPYLIYSTHSDNPVRANCVLLQPINKPGEIVGQLASRSQLVTSNAVMAVGSALYIDDDGGIKPGSGGKNDSPGSPRRLADVLAQFDCTFDFHVLDANQLLSLLPAEFDRFRNA